MLKLSDSTIAQIAKVLQIALLTGTDIVDNLRMIELQVDGDQLVISDEYKKQFEETLTKLQDEAAAAATTAAIPAVKVNVN
jgi:hypothetical protein